MRPLADVLTGPVDPTQGVGLVLTGGVEVPGGYLIALDVDGCRAPSTGAIEPWAREIVEAYGATYSEVTPSGTGIRVWVVSKTLPELGRSKAVLDYQRPPGVPPDKSVEIQVFGAGPAQYVTVTGDPIPGCGGNLATVDSLRWLVDRFGLQGDGPAARTELPDGSGRPPSMDEIEAAVRVAPHGGDFLSGDWKPMVSTDRDPSASAAYWRGVQVVLRAARGHGKAAVRFLLDRTPWGLGDIDDSADPGKYTREPWVATEVARVAGKAGALSPEAVFGVFDTSTFTPPPTPPPAPLDDPLGLIVPAAEFLRERDRAKFLVYNLIPKVGLVQFYGPPGCGKTPFALSLAIHVATDRAEWFGHTIDAHGGVLYMIGEDRSGIRDRLQAELDAMDIPHDGTALSFGARPGRLTDPEDAARWATAIQHHCPDGIELLVVDTQARNFGPANENDTEDMSRFVDHLAALATAFRCCVLLVHHSGFGAAGRGRGSSAMLGALDGEWSVERVSQHVVKAESHKEKNWAKPEPLVGKLVVRTVGTDTRGRDITAVTLQTEGPDAADVFTDIPADDPVRALLDVVAEIDGDPVTLASVATRMGCNRTSRRFVESTRRAVALGLVERETRKSTGRTVFTLTEFGRVARARMNPAEVFGAVSAADPTDPTEAGVGLADLGDLGDLGDLFEDAG